jgi:hypothetical protein
VSITYNVEKELKLLSFFRSMCYDGRQNDGYKRQMF